VRMFFQPAQSNFGKSEAISYVNPSKFRPGGQQQFSYSKTPRSRQDLRGVRGVCVRLPTAANLAAVARRRGPAPAELWNCKGQEGPRAKGRRPPLHTPAGGLSPTSTATLRVAVMVGAAPGARRLARLAAQLTVHADDSSGGGSNHSPQRPHPQVTVRVGVYGCGGHAVRAHLPSLRALPGVEIVALADFEVSLAEQAAAKCVLHSHCCLASSWCGHSRCCVALS
jgi:hypothetical protein